MVIASHAGSIVELRNRLAKVLGCLGVRTITTDRSESPSRRRQSMLLVLKCRTSGNTNSLSVLGTFQCATWQILKEEARSIPRNWTVLTSILKG
ncbi:unnamed protein product [Lasius platythorax]|uniref:Uncharacterized protein n=1 Tax=Lasius platythorax TaxID=488582 RepID=A0AAV2NJZ5_9HYME